ncbi:serine/threonine protein phosphatase [Erythrobacteraceae bacterium CFH 75059]|uniref:metallophosphoesterase family protein n=1 Tax=Qipengyuania thermophila TaxID=2509361 RepID=UPI0010202C8C|nr:metallophosphoesterase family protein [Qipengyuania thermophila]TCD02040.1 serine/threonine protein phosphatase [Erythrobacteraceae bacterium CFH 75059]
MFTSLRDLLRPRSSQQPPSVPQGERYYAIGDVHGRSDLLAQLIDRIEADDAEAGPADTTVIMLGDLVDRGHDSAGVIEQVMAWAGRRRVRCLAGNHEEMFLQAFRDETRLRTFVKHGGRETILSYGIPVAEYNALTVGELLARLPSLVPVRHREFLQGFEEYIVAGDYVFVHAGIRPNRPLEEQDRESLLWIRESFIKHTAPHSHVVVHGHTIVEDAADYGNRIAIDTGAYRTGRLTALVLEGAGRRYLEAADRGDAAAA